MSDESALRNALGAYPEKHGQGDNAALKSALNDLKYTVRQSVYNTPYPNTPAPSAPKPTTPPTQPTTTPTQTAGAAQLPASASGAPTVTYAPQAQAQPQDLMTNLAGNFPEGVQNVAGMTGLPQDNPLVQIGGNLLGLAQSAGDIAGAVGQGINELPVVGNFAENAGKAVAWGLDAYNRNINEPVAGIAAGLAPYVGLAGQAALMNQGITAQVLGNKERTAQVAEQMANPTNFQALAPNQATQDTAALTWDKLSKGDVLGAAQGLLDTFNTYGEEQYHKLDPATALAASLVFDPLNFVPGLGIEKLQKASKLAEITQDVGRIEHVAELAPKGIMGRIMTPAAKVTETVKSALQNIGLRTQYADNADEIFNTYRAFEKAGQDAKGFDQIVKTYAGMASVPAQRASRLAQGFGKELDTIEQGYRTMETALRGADELTDVSKLPKTFQNFIKDVKAGTASADDALDVLKAEMASRTSKYFAEQGAKLFPVKGMAAPVKVAERFMNELRGFESLVYIGLSPFTFVRNVINGVSTMAIEGLNPLFDASREIERLTKLGQVSKAKELERAIQFQETLMQAGGEVRKAMGLGSYGTGATGYFGNFMSNMIHGTPLGKPLQWYRQMENAMRARVWSQTYYRALQHNWDVGKFIPEMDAVTQAVLHQYRVDPQKIMDIVREAGVHDKKGVATEVLKYLRGERAGALDVERLAGEMGLSKQQLLSFLDEHDVAKAQSMAQEIAAQVANGKHPAQAVNDVVGQAAKETADEVIARTGAQAPEAAQTGMSLQELEQRRGELVAQWAAASKTRGGRKIADDLAAEIDAVEREIERMGYTGEKSFESAPDVAQAAQNVAPETAQETAQAAQEAGTIPLPEDLRFSQFASEWDAMTDPQRELMIGLERAKQTPMQVGVNEVLPQVADTYQAAGDVPTLMPDVTTGVPAPKEAPPTLGDVAKAAQGKGIATATAEGKPLNKHLLNVLNKHAAENGVERFASMADVQARAEDALKILDSYAPSNAPASVQKAVDELKNVIDPEGIKRQEIEWLKQRGNVPPSAGDMAKLPTTPNAPPAVPPSAPKEAWQMTRDEWGKAHSAANKAESNALKSFSGSPKQKEYAWGTPERIRLEYGVEARPIRKNGVPIVEHRGVIEKALAEGKPVPAEVLADYPDLAAKYAPAPEAVAAKGTSAPTFKVGDRVRVNNIEGVLESKRAGGMNLIRTDEGRLFQSYGDLELPRPPKPALTEIEAKAQKELARGKFGKSGGFTPTQEQYIVEHLKAGEREIKVPADGTVRVNNDYQAAQLEKVMTGQKRITPNDMSTYDSNINDEAMRYAKFFGSPKTAREAIAERAKALELNISDNAGTKEELFWHKLDKRLADFEKKMPKSLEKALAEKAAKAEKTGGTITDAARIADQIPTGEILTPDETARRANAIYEEINAKREIERLRQVATEDPQAVSILSRDEMLKAKARTQADMYEALMRVYQSEDAARVRVGTDAENRVMAWLRRDVFNGMDESRAAAQVTADWMDNAVMISRDGETHFDSALNWLSPFQFWGTRYALQSMRRVADKPARLMWYLKLRDMQDQVENDPRFPKRLRGMMTLPFPGAPKWAGSMWFDPLETFTQIESVFKMNQFDNALTDSDVAGAIRALVESGRVSPSEAANAIANKSGALWDATKAQMEEATKRQEGLDSITTAFKPHMPFDIIWKLRTGNAADIGVLFPMTRLIRNTTSLAPQGSFLNPTGTGINIEQPIKAGLRALTGNQSIPDWDQWEQYRVDRALADMVGDGTISERDALIAMIERKGGWYDEAQRRAQEQMRTQNFTSVFGGQMFPQGEQEYYKARVLKDQLINQAVAQLGGNPNDLSYGEKMELIRANGLNKKGTPLGDFYDQNPVYNARGDAYAEPEERLKGFLTDEVWQKYLALSALDKRMARQGNKDLAAFITNPERDYKAVTLEKAAEWVKYLRGYLPEAEQTPKVGALNQIQFAPPDLSAAYQTMQDEQKALFNLDAMQPRMDARAKMTPNEKRAFDAVNPDIAAYMKWYGQKMRDNPALAQLLNPDRQQQYATQYNQQSTNNYLTNQVVKNLNRMVSRLDDTRPRRFNPSGQQNKPRPLSRAAVMAIQQKRANPNYYIPRAAYRELVAAFKASGLRMSFEQWLQMMMQDGTV